MAAKSNTRKGQQAARRYQPTARGKPSADGFIQAASRDQQPFLSRQPQRHCGVPRHLSRRVPPQPVVAMERSPGAAGAFPQAGDAAGAARAAQRESVAGGMSLDRKLDLAGVLMLVRRAANLSQPAFQSA